MRCVPVSVQQHGLSYLALEFMDRGSLAARLDGQPLAPRHAAELVETLARAVQAAHERGIIHRDLKPANVRHHRRGTGEARTRLERWG